MARHNSLVKLFTLTLSISTFATPIQDRSSSPASSLTATDIIKIAPSTATCSQTANAFSTECATAALAAPNIAISYTNFGITTFGAQAALLALMLYESGNFLYDHNHFPAPGVPGQGTRNMQSPTYNLLYARWLAPNCANCGVSTAMVDAAQKQGPDAVLALVNGDQWGFGSAAWFLRTQCAASVLDGLGRGDVAGWTAYLGCVGTSATSERNAVWEKVMALGQW